MKIKRSLKWIMTMGILTVAMGTAGKSFDSEAKERDDLKTLSGSRPNIILFLADDLSYWDMSCFGQKEFSTPNVDRLAREGMTFSNAYAASPECAPSRGGLLTGLHMGHCPIRALGRQDTEGGRPYLSDHETLADVLKRAGYETCQIGKWHVGEPGTPGMPHLQGFETSLCFDHGDNKREQYAYPTRLWQNGERMELPENRGWRQDHPDNHFNGKGRFVPGGVPDPSKARYCEDIYLKKALQFIKEPREKPFFLYYATTLTHAEWPKELRKLKDKGAPWTLDQKRWAGQVTQMDRSLGAIIEELEKQGIEDNTIIIFASDNGYATWGYRRLSERVRWEDDPVLHNKGPWDRGKFICTNGGMIIPFIAWGPGLVKFGETDRAVVFYDLKVTFADLAGGMLLQASDGVSIVPLLSGKEDIYPNRDFLYWERGVYSRIGQSTLLKERFFALRMHPDKPIELYDVFKDPGCANNISSLEPKLIEQAKSIFISEHEEHPWYPELTKALNKMRIEITE